MPRPINDSDRSLVVQQVRVVVHTMGYFFDGDTRSGNHASIFLVTGSEQSIRLNIIKDGPTDTMGTLQIQVCEYVNSTSALRKWDFPAPPSRTVGQFLDLLVSKGRHRYQLARSGVGCRFWVSTMIEDYESARYLVSTVTMNAVSLKNALQYNYTRDQGPEYEPMVPGTFV
ncbi:uncharacterized protein DSM5745_10605 [Aspergillus mulundensis]|uniref:DUF7770 domain-containing protein n=1 Tax=Aspergillus mulundensis TaxID=1810919 RepID=A0A3D8QH92_9EURO|nr:hypothetical protein DSM5745_10605 [Aspergillus mulundensis]RDW61107.1 hypothetical protein DSM5745_10605 [Aspergillus mulundensis]